MADLIRAMGYSGMADDQSIARPHAANPDQDQMPSGEGLADPSEHNNPGHRQKKADKPRAPDLVAEKYSAQ